MAMNVKTAYLENAARMVSNRMKQLSLVAMGNFMINECNGLLNLLTPQNHLTVVELPIFEVHQRTQLDWLGLRIENFPGDRNRESKNERADQGVNGFSYLAIMNQHASPNDHDDRNE